ncbi:AMP-binding protein [Streptomyces sp. NPDC005820]|uniref:AMP-binding protein n=1 Tax=Streptomyces sp. NPDC005820 TaxID=3157069 RepID=UPI00340A853F
MNSGAAPDTLFHHFLLRHAADRPGHPAVVGERSTLTYAQLAALAHMYADHLRDWGVGDGDRIVLQLDPSPEALALLCACSLAGAVFVPLAPDCPPSRLAAITARTDAVLLVRAAEPSDTATAPSPDPADEPTDAATAPPPDPADPADPADEPTDAATTPPPDPVPRAALTPDGLRLPARRHAPGSSGGSGGPDGSGGPGSPGSPGSPDAPSASGAPGIRLATLGRDLAYLIFTSGTTGEPKGIMMSHRAVLAFWRALVAHCALGPQARVGSISPLQFDFSLLDYGLALGSGATLVLVPRYLYQQPRRMLDHLGRHGVTQMNGVPSIWSAVLRHTPGELSRAAHLEAVLFAGEAFPVEQLRRLTEAVPGLRVINCFGHSESVACSFHDLPTPLPDDLTSLPFSWGHPGAQLLLLDDSGRPVTRPGRVGELYLRADNLFSGYWRDPVATAAALVPNPLRPDDGEPVFRSRDLAETGEDGLLRYRGRADLQVKIRGNRVELEEVEHRLAAHPGISEAALTVQVQGEAGLQELRAVVVPAPGTTGPDPAELRRWCAEVLPSYMVPSEIRTTASLPVTANGKVDRTRLALLPAPTKETR